MKVFEHIKAVDQLLQDEDIHIRSETPEKNPDLDEPLVVIQAESDFSDDPVLPEKDTAQPTNRITVPTGTSEILGHEELFPLPDVQANSMFNNLFDRPRPGTKRKHVMETSTIVLRHGLIYWQLNIT